LKIKNNMANNIRRYDETYKILRNVSNPVMIYGLPLNLALIYCSGIFLPIILALLLKVVGIGIIMVITIPVLVGLFILIGVKTFYKKYGINGFQLQNRDMSLPNQIDGDMSLQSALREKLLNAK
jgi:hypothetical protein